MKYFAITMVITLTACTATSKRGTSVQLDDKPAPIITELDIKEYPYWLAAPLFLAAAWMTLAYIRERSNCDV